MSQFNKILLSVFFLLIVIIAGETGYLFSQNQKPSPVSAFPTLVQKSVKKSLTKEQLSVINDPYYQKFFPVSYDEEKNRVYTNFPPKYYVSWIKNMGADFAALISMSHYTKGQVESLIVIDKLRGTISDLNTNKIIDGKRYLYFKLTGKDQVKIEYYENEGFITKAKFVKILKGKEVSMDWEKELKDGDEITMEGKVDLTLPPNDPNSILEAKLTKL